MSRRSLVVYNYAPVPDVLPPSKRKTNFLDTLDVHIESLWSDEVRKLLQPIGHPQSKRFFLQQYQAVQLIQAEAAVKGLTAISDADVWTMMAALRRVAARRGISPRQLLITDAQVAAE